MNTHPVRPKRNTPPRKQPYQVKARKVGRLRMEDRLAKDWRPLTDLELRSLNSVADREGNYKIDRQLLAKLMGERERLSMIAESARSLIAACEEIGLERKPKDKVTPNQLEKGIGSTRQALESYDGDLGAAGRSS